MPKGRMRRVHRYSNEFKITAVKLACLPERTYGTLVQSELIIDGEGTP